MNVYYDMTPQMEAVATAQAERLAGPLLEFALENARQFPRGEVSTISYAVLAMSLAKLLHTEDQVLNVRPTAAQTRQFLIDVSALVNQHRHRIHEQARGVLN